MQKEMLWFFGAMAFVAVAAFLVGITTANVDTAKVVAMFGCIVVGALVSAYRDADDSMVVPKFFMFACTGMAILCSCLGFWVGVTGAVFFGMLTAMMIWIYWSSRPEGVKVLRAVATCAAYIIPAVILVPLTIYL